MTRGKVLAAHRFSIALKLALVSWLVTVFTLLLFLAVIVPEQLSVQSYGGSVATVYLRTGMLAVACIAISLIVSILYARHLVQPIKALQAVQQRVTQGDLAARATIRSRDEVENLADSFNAMTETLQQRDRILECVRLAAQAFLMAQDWSRVLEDVLAQLGQAAQAWRIDVFTLHRGADGFQLPRPRYEWVSKLVPGGWGPSGRADRLWLHGGIENLVREVQGKGVVAGPVGQLDPALAALLEPLELASLVLTPVIVNGAWWGIICMGECRRRRNWTDAEQDSLRAVADMLGAAITRSLTQEELLEAKDTLEQRVQKRTSELQEQMKAKAKAHAELAEAQQRLIELSRRAGMAEVATGVLHNVGNVLNSVNVSTTLIRERLRHSEVASLVALCRLLHEHQADLSGFLADPRGTQVFPFLFQLADQLQAENRLLQDEQDHLVQNIEHVKEIVRMQQGFATLSGYLEPLELSALVDGALRINAESLRKHGIQVTCAYAELPRLMLDKHKLIQILVNIIQNAKQALLDSGREDKRLHVTLVRKEGQVEIAIHDNGIGIPPENLTRIFSHGFSTRPGGHGFGLHAGALAAEELGGRLGVQSEGAGLGSTFTLSLPMTFLEPEQRSL